MILRITLILLISFAGFTSFGQQNNEEEQDSLAKLNRYGKYAANDRYTIRFSDSLTNTDSLYIANLVRTNRSNGTTKIIESYAVTSRDGPIVLNGYNVLYNAHTDEVFITAEFRDGMLFDGIVFFQDTDGILISLMKYHKGKTGYDKD